MAEDFPAAHSMDTDWYAVDRHGHVGVFSTGENGHLPTGAAGGGRLREELARLLHLPPDAAWGDPEEVGPRLGVFFYDYGEGYGPLGPYLRSVAPQQPLHVDQLPPALRRDCKQVCFGDVSFAQSECVQPLEFFECRFWYNPPAYLCADGRTVRPVPGRQDEFAVWCRELQEEFPEIARQLRFEGPGVEGLGPAPEEGSS
jgi:hypothetical protein